MPGIKLRLNGYDFLVVFDFDFDFLVVVGLMGGER